MIDYKIIGERLKKARIDKKITQLELAKKIGCSVAFLSRIEKASSYLSLKRLSQICNALGVSEGSVLNGTNENDNNYLNRDFKEILNKATDEQKKMIYEVSKTIINN